MRSFVIACDNAAVDLKNTIVDFLRSKNVQVEDQGVNSKDDGTVYPLIAKRLCETLAESNFEKRGILICGTGIGMCMTANKFKGIRAAVCHDNYSAERSILSNNGNVLCMGARVIGPELAKKIVGEWINLEFKDGSSTPKVETIIRIEQENMQ